MTRYLCCDERRRAAVLGHTMLNGIDFLEVRDGPLVTPDERQRTLFVHFIKPLSEAQITQITGASGPSMLHIAGGERVRGILVTSVELADSNPFILAVTVSAAGDFSRYRLRLQAGEAPPAWCDPRLASVEFSFKAACPSDFDCVQDVDCPPALQPEPLIDYLAKDYASFRRLLLDRMGALLPGWQARLPADMGVALVELLAYTGDYLSYQQDAIATEAYMGTARLRSSLRRHARLVDYPMHDGCNARTWVQVRVSDDLPLPPRVPLLTRVGSTPARLRHNSPEHRHALEARPEVFETLNMAAMPLYVAHNELHFYTWGDQECSLPAGATCATLRGSFPQLAPGHVLIFVEQTDPRTGSPSDADPAHRHAVQLTRVTPDKDPLGGRFSEPPTDESVTITEIEWHADDALPFSLCISAQTTAGYRERISLALGNIVLADHGRSVKEVLPEVPPPHLFYPFTPNCEPCDPQVQEPLPVRYRPRLKSTPITQAAPPAIARSATAALRLRPEDALPAIRLETGDGVPSWTPRRDLLNSRADEHFVVEVETDGHATLRFGDGQHGRRPLDGTHFTASYRSGNGAVGNIGAQALYHIVLDEPGLLADVVGVTNPLPASGGTEAESLTQVRQAAPYAFRTQERAVTAEDYAAVALRHPEVQRAVATFRWTGSWRTVFLSIDRKGGEAMDARFEAELRHHMERYRMAGYDLEIDDARYVSVELVLRVCVLSSYARSDVRRALLEVLSSRRLPNGRRGLFHPDNLTFGQPFYLSPILAAAQAIAGVASLDALVFRRQGDYRRSGLALGRLDLGRLEIARLDNDPNYPEHGLLRLELEGGR